MGTLRAMFNPRTVALIGATDKEGTIEQLPEGLSRAQLILG